MSDHKARELEHDTAPKHPKGRKETFAERDPLAAEEPTVLESSGARASSIAPRSAT